MNKIIYIFAYYNPRGLSAISEQIDAWKKYSRYRVVIVNLYKTYQEYGMRLIDTKFIAKSSAIIIHPTVSYTPSNLAAFCQSILQNGRMFDGPIILYKQDEHVRSHETAKLIGEYGIDIVLTCTHKIDREKVYPKSMVGNAIFEQVYTGYFTESLINAPNKDWKTRSIDLFYRGSKQPPEIGRLGFEKYLLARKAINACKTQHLYCDASSEWEDRILGYDWILTLGDSKATIGAESGSNCFDFDGRLSQQVKIFLAENPDIDPWSETGYRKLHTEILYEFEDNVCYGQIAPRHLEAVATRTPQLLLKGSYSGKFKPGRHYLELNSDFSNLYDLLEILEDEKFRNCMVECAFDEIAKNPQLQYTTFIRRIDEFIEGNYHIKSSNVGNLADSNLLPNDQTKLNVLLICPHEEHVDPRIEWWAKYTSSEWNVHVVETSQNVTEIGGVVKKGAATISARAMNADISELPDYILDLCEEESLIELLSLLSELSQPWLVKNCSSDHLWLVRHIVNQSIGLIEAGIRVRGIDFIIAVDVPSLLAGLFIRKYFSIPLVYDAQEIWSYSNLSLEWTEIQWWDKFERRLLYDVDIPVTVSPGIADWYFREMNRKMYVVPNFGPYINVDKKAGIKEIVGPVRFIFLGNFAPSRGLEKLIEAWDFDPELATLTLQGPNSNFKEECKKISDSLGRNEHGVIFADPVTENNLIEEASKYHIGVIPYVYPYPYSHCSPNKLSQYMVAGCAVLSHSQLVFVKECITDVNCGITANFKSVKSIHDRVKNIIYNKGAISGWRHNAINAASKKYNWDNAVSSVVDEIKSYNIHPKCKNIIIDDIDDYEKFKLAEDRRERFLESISTLIDEALYARAFILRILLKSYRLIIRRIYN